MVAGPLTRLSSTSFLYLWSEEAKAAFYQLKDLYTSAPVLIHPYPSHPFVVEVDASDTGVRAVLSQRLDPDKKLHPCDFYSKKLSPTERSYNMGDRALQAAVCGLD